MKTLKEIDKYLDKIDDEEVIDEHESKFQWTRRDYAKNVLIRVAMLVKFMALPTPELILKKQINMIRDRLDSIERLIENKNSDETD